MLTGPDLSRQPGAGGLYRRHFRRICFRKPEEKARKPSAEERTGKWQATLDDYRTFLSSNPLELLAIQKHLKTRDFGITPGMQGCNPWLTGWYNDAGQVKCRMNENIPCELITWAEIQRLANRLAQSIQKADYQPDIVIAIARGGYVPARLLCDLLNIERLTSLQVIHYTAGIQQAESARLTAPLNVDVKDLKVLIIDDVSETGETLRIAIDHVRSFRPSDVRIATLHHKTASSVEPDYYAKKILKWRWIGYPWARNEDVKAFIADMKPSPESPAEASRRLEEEHGIKVKQTVLEQIYAFLSKEA